MEKLTNFAPSLTLGQALETMRLQAPEAAMVEAMPPDMQNAFEQHDAIHILFDCGTALRDEIAVHIWMAFGTNVKLREMHHAMANAEHQNVLSGIGHLQLLSTWLLLLPRLVRIWFKCQRMSQPIDMTTLDRLKSQTLESIRHNHGLVL